MTSARIVVAAVVIVIVAAIIAVRRIVLNVAAIGALMEAEHARLSAPRHERAQADYAGRRRDRPPPADAANPAPSWRPEQDDGFPWGFRDGDGVWTELPKTPLLLAGYGPPPFDVTLPSGEVRRVEQRR